MNTIRSRSALRLGARIGGVIAVLALAAWIVSVLRCGIVECRTVDGPHQRGGIDGWFEVKVVNYSLFVLKGRCGVAAEGFVTGMRDAQSLKDHWKGAAGWSANWFTPRGVWFDWNVWSERERRVLGLGYDYDSGVGTDEWRTKVYVPCWLFVVGGVCPVMFYMLVVKRRARRRAAGLCEKCEYSRAGVPAGSPCPECGCTPQRDA